MFIELIFLMFLMLIWNIVLTILMLKHALQINMLKIALKDKADISDKEKINRMTKEEEEFQIEN